MHKLLFNNIFIPRKIDKIIEKEKLRVQKLLEQEVIDGNLDLSYNKWIRDLGNIKRVEGYLDLNNSSIQTLGNLEYVGNSLALNHSEIIDLGKLEYVGRDLWLYNTLIQSLNNLKFVGGHLVLSNSKVQDLGELEYVGWDLHLQNTPLLKQFSVKEELEQYIRIKIKVEGDIYV